MTPKEKAQELVYNIMFKDTSFNRVDRLVAHKIALICVDEICEAINWHEFESPNKQWEYWNNVKQEIEKL